MAEIVEKKVVNLDGGTAIEAFPGVGLVGHIAGSYLINALNMEMIGYIVSDKLPPFSVVLEGSVIPPVRIHAYRNIVVFISDIPPPTEAIYELTKEIADFIKRKKIGRSISLAGIATGKQGEKVYAASTEKEYLQGVGAEALKIGTIVGASGSLLLECKRLGIPGIGLLAETVGNIPDPRASALLVAELGRMLNLTIDVGPLLEEAAQWEERAQQMIEEMAQKEEKGEYVPMYR